MNGWWNGKDSAITRGAGTTIASSIPTGATPQFIGERSSSSTRSCRACHPDARVLDVGAGEGVLVEKYRAQGRNVVGVDANYESPSVKKASLASLPFEDGSFDAVLCLDVLEHLDLLDQAPALREIKRCLTEDGTLLLSVPNLAHLHSRLRFFLGGKLTRTSALERHPGDRPAAEYLQLLDETGFRVIRRKGIFPTAPIVFRLVNRNPARWGWAVGFLDRVLPFPSLCFLNVIEAKR